MLGCVQFNDVVWKLRYCGDLVGICLDVLHQMIMGALTASAICILSTIPSFVLDAMR